MCVPLTALMKNTGQSLVLLRLFSITVVTSPSFLIWMGSLLAALDLRILNNCFFVASNTGAGARSTLLTTTISGISSARTTPWQREGKDGQGKSKAEREVSRSRRAKTSVTSPHMPHAWQCVAP